jgi:hypothetical protein
MDQGVVFLDDLPVNAVQAAREAGLSVKSYVKPHFKYVGGNRRDFHLREKDIREDWLKVTEDVVFWEKGSMCALVMWLQLLLGKGANPDTGGCAATRTTAPTGCGTAGTSCSTRGSRPWRGS